MSLGKTHLTNTVPLTHKRIQHTSRKFNLEGKALLDGQDAYFIDSLHLFKHIHSTRHSQDLWIFQPRMHSAP